MSTCEPLRDDPVQVRAFRDYQGDVVRVVGRGPHGLSRHDWLIEAPTGSGKTTLAIALLADLLGDTFTHGLIVAPMRQIEDGFLVTRPTTFHWPAGSMRTPLEIPAGFVRAARDGDNESACREILEYLDTKNPGYVPATTHAALSRLVERHAGESRKNLKRCLLVVDEAHRAPAKSLSRAVELWRGRKGRLLYLTATPHRADGLPVVLPGMKVYRRSAAEHMEGGLYSPGLCTKTAGCTKTRVAAQKLKSAISVDQRSSRTVLTASRDLDLVG